MRRIAFAVIAFVAVALIALAIYKRGRSQTVTPQRSFTTVGDGGVSDARGLSSAERARLRDRILAGNAKLAAALAVSHEDATVVDAGPTGDGASHILINDAGVRELVISAEMTAYREKTFELANKIVEDCMAKHEDSGNKLEVEYVVIADDEAGGLFEDVKLPPAGNTSGPETLECMTEGMLAATLPAPPSDIGMFTFGVAIDIIIRDGGPD